jgi:hypothetical protein
MKEGYKQEIEHDKLVVSKNGQVYATATYDEETGLLKMDKTIQLSAGTSNSATSIRHLTQQQLHQTLGHVSNQMVQRTLPAISGLKTTEVRSNNNTPLCQPCELGKARRQNRVLKGTPVKEVLEVVEMDSQGPFPITAFDGTNGNIKIIDKFSSYCHMITVFNTNSLSALSLLKRFQSKLERQTGKKLQRIGTDGGTEFKGVFLDYISDTGLTINSSNPYEHHLPGSCERVHQSIMNSARAMLIASKLPLRYYSAAQLHACYLHNRTVHANHTKTPYEYIYNEKPNLSHLRPFGSICYALIPSEVRNKLTNTAERCRLLGYSDSEDIVQHKGYFLLRESDLSTFYSRDVRFDNNAPMEPLNDEPAFHDDDGDNLFNDITYLPVEDVPDDNSSYRTADTGSDSGGDIDMESEASLINDSENTDASQIDDIDDLTSYGPAFHASHVQLDANSIFTSYVALAEQWPQSLKEAQQSKEWPQWKTAIQQELNAHKLNATWTYRKPPSNIKNIVKSRWVFVKKYDKDGNILKYKARLVAKGFTQRYGIDYTETFAPVVLFKSVRLLAALIAALNLEAFQDDVPTAFLRGDLKEEIYMEPPEGLNEEIEDGMKCLLMRTLYGLKQSPREWNEVVDKYLLKNGFTATHADPCLYKKGENETLILVAVYVDDIITAGKDSKLVDEFRTAMCKHFKMNKGNKLEWYLGIRFSKNSDGTVTLDQEQYIKNKVELYKQFIGTGGVSTPLPLDTQKLLQNAESSGPADINFPYRAMCGSAMYAMLGTRPDIAFAISVVCRFLDKPTKTHQYLLQHLFKYLRCNSDLGLTYQSGIQVLLSGYVDAAYANDEGYKSTSGFCFSLGSGIISWYSKRQSVVAQSSAESEYYATVSAANEAIWFKSILMDLGFPQATIDLYEDNQACIALSKNPEDHKRTKHIQVKYHIIRDYVKNKDVNLKYCRTKEQWADIFTKSLPGHKIRTVLPHLGVIPLRARRRVRFKRLLE